MFDIDFFMKTLPLKHDIVSGTAAIVSREALFNEFESHRKQQPHVFNVETTNNCNMTCVMCPRTELMDRPITSMSREDFESVLDQMDPHDEKALDDFWRVIEDTYGITQDEESENAFYFHVVSRCLVLHGYGEPLLDAGMAERIRSCTARAIPTYFSCVPANIRLNRVAEIMEGGLDVLKFSVDALDDERHKAIRGKNSDFKKSFDAILAVLEHKTAHPELATRIVITMLSLSGDAQCQELEDAFVELWKPHPVYAYVKTQDNRWYYKKDQSHENRSHYESQYCEFPWTSLSVMSNGVVVPCTQDYNAEMAMGNIKEQSLTDIWNGEKYAALRRAHIKGDFPQGFKCNGRCDLKKLYQRLG